MKHPPHVPGLHPEFLRKNGKDFVVLPSEEFEAVREILEDLEDLLELRAAKASDTGGPGMSIQEAKRKYGL